MATQKSPNYPDVFGYITDIERCNMGLVQVGLAARPQAVQAGRPLEAIVLLQNASDTHVDVVVSLQLPAKDSAGTKGCFSAPKEQLVVGLEPAEAGYVTLPILTKPSTAAGNDYSVLVNLELTPKSKKARRIRGEKGGGRFNLARVAKKSRPALEELKKLKFSAETKGGFLKGKSLFMTFGVMKGGAGKAIKLKPNWVSLWSLDKQSDSEPLLDMYGDVLKLKIFPGLKRHQVFQPLYEKTVERFEGAGYPLTEAEARTITRLLTTILEFAFSGELVAQGGQAAGVYNILSVLNAKRLPGEDDERPLPRWAVAFLQALASDERFARVPPGKTLGSMPKLYDALFFDAILYAFQVVERDTGEELGTDQEMAAYAGQILMKITKKEPLAFADVYLPLMLGGVIITDLMLLKEERLVDVMRTLVHIVDDRSNEEHEGNEFVFDLARTVLERKLRQYGTLDSGR